ncbi:RagB/SusD family nutrient uptake outer membrane protein [uncultured Proteiniphilum sp.]|uniref:RagB/SusD family nutrient uptake outer membrane protein n=1 Tax=uncultured Proteiniphilum sp. TaxID=497637 RepID=UPI00261BF1E3|nr:RagB/SusD family nutrient uptake outer membrane protein [uncultured Proteiniphilum sp.]
MKLNKNLIKSLIVIFLATSCQDLDLLPYDRETDASFWKKPESALYMVNKCYSEITDAFEILYSDAMTDNGYTKVSNAFNQSIGNGSYSTSDQYVAAVWDGKYSGIRNCNLLLTNIDNVPNLNDELKNRYKAEAMFIRAFHYFELYSKFGDIPYFTHVLSVNESETIGRTPKAEIVENILIDLNAIIDNNHLPTSYSGNDTGRATIWAAMALKARILLFEGRYNEVKTVTGNIISDGGFTLFPSYEGLFKIENENNQEVIFDYQYMPITREHNVQYHFVPPSLDGYSQLSPLQELIDSYITLDGYNIDNAPQGSFNINDEFNNRDPRLKAAVVYTGNSYVKADGTEAVINCDQGANPDGYGYSSNSTATGYYLKKYWDNTYRANLMSGLNIILIRYADVLLMNAEALAELGELDETAWNNTIRILRQRAGFSDNRALSFPASGNLVEIVRNERRNELAFEGLRHKDIIRWKIAENVLNGWAHGLHTGEVIGTDNGYIRVENRTFDPAKHYLWPIPQKDRDINKNLTQNPKW